MPRPRVCQNHAPSGRPRHAPRPASADLGKGLRLTAKGDYKIVVNIFVNNNIPFEIGSVMRKMPKTPCHKD